ncbi:hypothetical protein BT63DRAFT_442742 [Microthyrium microscopicum]|uniref:Ubiquitin-like domain-containing protein n=1 Tax=Microthyrium microscopicum TaxID=703497 RepID=A0A6A6U301_9PEZI|nr:hypothetical protein BT63DRAFT_442742 [Microthyrium microscopicum]
MTDTPPNQDSGTVRDVNLKVIWPGVEADAALQLPNTPLSMTILALKSKIKDSLPSHPREEKQRLICHGRLCSDGETVGDIFARAPLDPQDRTPRALHLIIDNSSPRGLTAAVPHGVAAALAQPRASSMPPVARDRIATQEQPFAMPRGPTMAQPPAQRDAGPHGAAHPAPRNRQPYAAVMPHNQAELLNNVLNQTFAAFPQMMQQPGFPPGAQQGLQQGLQGLQQGLQGFQQGLPQGLPNPFGVPVAQHNVPQQPFSQGAQNGQAAPQGPRTAPATRSTSPHPLSDLQQQNPALANPQPQFLPGVNINHYPGFPPGVNPAFPLQQGNHVILRHHVTVNGLPVTPGAPQPGAPLNGHFMPNGFQQPGLGLHPHMLNQGVRMPFQPGAAQYQGNPAAYGQMPYLPGTAPASFGMNTASSSGSPGLPNPISRAGTPMSSSGQIGPEERNQRFTEQMYVLSAQLSNISQQIHQLSHQVVTRRNIAAQARQFGLTHQQALAYSHTMNQVVALFRAFDQQAAHVMAMFRDVLPSQITNIQQMQDNRRQAEQALGSVYSMVRSHITAFDNTRSMRGGGPDSNADLWQSQNGQQTSWQTLNTIISNIPSTSSQPQLYLLYDTQGNPYALLVGPQGQYSTNCLPPNIVQALVSTQLPMEDIISAIQAFTETIQRDTMETIRQNPMMARPRRVQRNAGPAERVVAQAVDQANPNGAAQAPRPAQPDEMRDLLAPIVRNLWLLIRLGFFAYFLFGGNRSLWRPFLLGSGLLLAYVVQAGLFGLRVDGFRRYLDRIVGVDNPLDANNNAAPAANAAAAPAGEPNPQALAQQLIQRHQNQNAGWARAVERTIGLFVASLWPGIGERAVHLQEDRERRAAEEVERVRREAEEREQERLRIEAEQAAENENGGGATDGDATPTSDPATPKGATAGSSDGATASGAHVNGDGEMSRVNKGKDRAPDGEDNDES